MIAPFLKKALPHVVAILVFLVISVVYCKPALEGKVVHQADVMGYKGMAQQSEDYKAKNGHYPLWTQSTFSGMPTYNIDLDASLKIQVSQLYYILTLGMPKPISFFFLACVTFYFLALVMGMNPWISTLSAIGYAWSTYDPIIVFVGHDTKMLAMAYAPGIFAGLLLLYRKKYMWGAVIVAIFMSLQANTEHFQVLYYTLLSMGIFTICYLIYSWKQQQLKGTLIGIAIAGVSVAVGIATNAVLVLPVHDLAPETMRGGRTELTQKDDPATPGKAKAAKGLDKDYAFTWSYGIPETFTLLVPRAAGGGTGAQEVGENSKAAEKLTETFGMSQDQALQTASVAAYWGGQNGQTSGPVYLGAIVCLLFILGLVYVKGWAKWWLVSISVLGIVLAWGKNFSAVNYFLFDHFPYYNKFRAPTLALILPQFAFPLLGGLALQQIIAGTETKENIRKKFKTSAIITGALLLITVFYYFTASYAGLDDQRLKDNVAQGRAQQLAQGRQPSPEVQAQAMETANSVISALKADRQSIFGADLLRTIILVLLGGGLIWAYVNDKLKQKQLLLGALIVLSTYDLLGVGLRYLNEDKFVEASDFDGNLAPTAADQQIKQDPEKGYRVFDMTGEPFQMSAQSARASFNHNNIGGYSPAKLGLYQDLLVNQLYKGNPLVINMLNTKYVIQDDPRTRQPVAQRNGGANGAAWFVKTIRYVPNGDAEMKALDSTDNKNIVLIDQRYKSKVAFEPEPDSTATIKVIDYDLEKITYKTSARTNQFAVFSEIYYDKGWQASIDGKPADYLRVDYVLRGLPVPAGEHTIEFVFKPRSYIMGDRITTWTTLLVFLGLLGAIIVEWRKRSRKA